jgi:tetratricopeptide (TPR) repeat protein
MPGLSICMITRNEESMLPGCLASVRGLADEVIVVDTGSDDGTVDIARRAGARVSQMAWRDDFAAARNASLALARGAFVLVLDADERLAPGAARAIRSALARDDFDCGLLPLHNAARLDATPDEVTRGAARRGEPNFLPRLLRRTPDLRFEGVVHESILGWLDARRSRIRFIDAPIVHLGGVEEVRERLHKAERNITLLEKASAAAPEEPAWLGYLAHEYFDRGRRDDARAVIERGWALIERAPPKPGMSVLRLATARARDQLERGDTQGVLATVDRAERIEGEHPDLAFLRGVAYEHEGLASAEPAHRTRCLEAALSAYRAAIEKRGHRYAQAFVDGASTWAGETRAGTALLVLGLVEEAQRAFASALAARPGHREAQLGVVECLLAGGRVQAALSALLSPLPSLLDERPDGWLLGAVALDAAGMPGDARLLLLRARERAPRGYLSPHRRARHLALCTRALAA